MVSATVTEVTGGITASYVGALRLAGVFDDASDRLASLAATGARLCASPDLAASLALSPDTAVAAETAVLSATGQLVPCALEAEASAVAVRQAVQLLQAADGSADLALSMAKYGVGYGMGAAAPMVAPPLAIAAAGAAVLPSSWWADADALAATTVAAHPEATQHLIGLLPGFVDGVTGLPGAHPTMTSLAGSVASMHHEDGLATTAPTCLDVPASQTVPGSLADLVHHLSQVNDLPDGAVEVQTVTLPDGTVQHIVYLPGTDDMNPLSHDEQVRDMQGNTELVAGQPTAYGAGVLDALHQAGVQPGEPIMLVGHSQGGMQAMALGATQTPYDVTQIVTAGAPVAGVDLPPQVSAISLEHDGDVIPLTDGGDNPDAANHVTIAFDSGSTGVVGNHSLDHYESGAEAADASDDPAIATAVEEASTFFQQGEVTSTVYTITRP